MEHLLDALLTVFIPAAAVLLAAALYCLLPGRVACKRKARRALGWVLALGGVGAGAVQAVPVAAGWGWCALIWRAADSSYCTNAALQIWLLFNRKPIKVV